MTVHFNATQANGHVSNYDRAKKKKRKKYKFLDKRRLQIRNQ